MNDPLSWDLSTLESGIRARGREDMLPLYLLLNFSFADTLIGTCRFWGDEPHYISAVGNFSAHHQGDLRRTGFVGTTEVWEGTGPVWVIYTAESAKSKYQFRVNGSLQTCDRF
jgi:hypothetical protein